MVDPIFETDPYSSFRPLKAVCDKNPGGLISVGFQLPKNIPKILEPLGNHHTWLVASTYPSEK